MKKSPGLPLRILLALGLGVAVGLLCRAVGESGFAADYLKPFGTIFVNLLKLLVAPVVLLSLIDGILSMEDLKKVGAVGSKALAYFLCTTAAACVIGLSFASFFDRAGLFPQLATEAGGHWESPSSVHVMDTLVGIFPSNLWEALLNANMLQIIVIALLFGGAILSAGEAGTPCRTLAASLYAVVGRLMAFIIRLSPVGVFAMMAWVTAVQGAEVLGALGLVLLCAYLAYAAHALAIYSLSVRVFAGVSPARFFRGSFAAVALAFSSASSAAALPVSRTCADELGADGAVSAFVLPLGSTINMDGTAIYQCVAGVFLAACAGMHLTLEQMVLVVLTATLSSIGTAGVSGSGMIMLAMVLTAMGVDVDMIMILYGVDRLFDMGRTSLNVAGDIACSLCVSSWSGKPSPPSK